MRRLPEAGRPSCIGTLTAAMLMREQRVILEGDALRRSRVVLRPSQVWAWRSRDRSCPKRRGNEVLGGRLWTGDQRANSPLDLVSTSAVSRGSQGARARGEYVYTRDLVAIAGGDPAQGGEARLDGEPGLRGGEVASGPSQRARVARRSVGEGDRLVV